MKFSRELRVALLLGGIAVLAACGGKDDVLRPAPLPDIKPEVHLEKAWSASVGGDGGATGVRLEPAINAQTVYAADARGRLSARNRANGNLLWSTDTSLAISAGPVAGYGQLFTGTREGELVAFSADDGHLLWRAQLGGELLAPPVVDGDDVVATATDGHVTLLDRTDGSVRWVYDGGAPPLALRAASRPLVLVDAVVAGLATGELVAIERASGKRIWERRIAEPEGKSELERLVDIAGDFLIVGDRLHAATFQGRVVAMDLGSGQFTWQQPFSTFRSLAYADGTLFAVDADSRVVAFRATDGVVLWRQEALLARGLTGCAVAGKYLLSGDFEGYVHVIRQADGVVVGRRRIDRDGIVATPVVDEGMAFVLGRGGKLAALKLK